MNRSSPSSTQSKTDTLSQLPSFDTLIKMADEQPEALEALRVSLAEELIQSAPPASQRRLRGLQFKIDMERRRAKNPMSACVRMSEMMQESFIKLRNALNEASQSTPQITKESTAAYQESKQADELKKTGSAQVIRFPVH